MRFILGFGEGLGFKVQGLGFKVGVAGLRLAIPTTVQPVRRPEAFVLQGCRTWMSRCKGLVSEVGVRAPSGYIGGIGIQGSSSGHRMG